MFFRNGIFSSIKLSLFIVLLSYVIGAPVPIPKNLNNDFEEEEGLLVLVPTVAADGKGQPTKREIDYEVISIPKELILKTVKEVTQSYGTRGGPLPNSNTKLNSVDEGSIYISNLKTGNDDEILIKTRSAPAYDGNSRESPNLNILSTKDLSQLLSSVASAGLSAASTGANLAGQAKNVLNTATRVGTSAVVGGTQAVRWALKQKTSGLRSFAEFAGTGIQYAGRLTSAVLKVLLRVPGIKAKVISDLIQAGQPFATAVSDVISESADDLGDIFSAQTDIFKDAVNILFKLITDVLALKGRILASFGAGGLDRGANLISAGVKVGSAFVQSAGDVVSAVGRGVGELVQVASDVEFPPPPALPTLKFPSLPTLSYPSSSSSEYKPPAISYKSPSSSDSGENSYRL